MFTTGCWYYRLSRPVHGDDVTGLLSRQLGGLEIDLPVRVVAALDLLRDSIGLLSLRDLVPVMQALPISRPLNMLNAAALAAALVLDADLVVCTDGPLLREARRSWGSGARCARGRGRRNGFLLLVLLLNSGSRPRRCQVVATTVVVFLVRRRFTWLVLSLLSSLLLALDVVRYLIHRLSARIYETPLGPAGQAIPPVARVGQGGCSGGAWNRAGSPVLQRRRWRPWSCHRSGSPNQPCRLAWPAVSSEAVPDLRDAQQRRNDGGRCGPTRVRRRRAARRRRGSQGPRQGDHRGRRVRGGCRGRGDRPRPRRG